MKENGTQDVQGDAGSNRSGGSRRACPWLLALALIGLGALGGALTTVALDADAHGWRKGYGHHWHGSTVDAEQVIDRMQHVSAWALGSVDATDEQRERVDAILTSAVKDLFPLRAEHHAHTRDLIAELASPQIDRAGLERVRAAELALAEKATARLVDATVAIAEVLEPEQRQELLERFASYRH